MLIGVVLDDMLGNDRTSSARAVALLRRLGDGRGARRVRRAASRGSARRSRLRATKADGRRAARLAGARLVAVGVAVVAIVLAMRFSELRDDRGPTKAQPRTRPPSARGVPRAAACSARRGRRGGALVVVLVGRDLVDQAGGRRSAGRDPPAPALHVQLPPRRGPSRSTSPRSLAALHDRRRARSASVLAVRALAPARGRRDRARFAFVWARLGPRRLHGEDRRRTGVSTRSSRRTTSDRSGPEEPLVAYQMNWKGENFYTGNHDPGVRLDAARTFTHVAEAAEGEGREGDVLRDRAHAHRRAPRRGRRARATRRSPTRTLCNKFVLVRAEL